MRAPHLLPLTGIRFCAALWIVLFHFQRELETLLPCLKPLAPFSAVGHEAVPLFFLLSGFILSHNYFAGYSLGQHPKFLFLRFARLWPVHVVTFLLMAGDDFVPYSRGQGLGAAVQEISMVRSWFSDSFARNYPAWSISAEWLVYICIFPLAVYFFRPLRSWPALVAIAAGMLLCHWRLHDLFSGISGSAIFLFLAGSALYRVYSLVRNPPAQAIALGGLLLLLAYLFCHRWLPELVLYAAFCLLIFGLAYERGWLARLLSVRWMVQGGLISYSLYMTHVLVVQSYLFFLVGDRPHPLLQRVSLFLGLIAALIGAAALCYHFVEVPANHKLRALAFDDRPKDRRPENEPLTPDLKSAPSVG